MSPSPFRQEHRNTESWLLEPRRSADGFSHTRFGGFLPFLWEVSRVLLKRICVVLSQLLGYFRYPSTRPLNLIELIKREKRDRSFTPFGVALTFTVSKALVLCFQPLVVDARELISSLDNFLPLDIKKVWNHNRCGRNWVGRFIPATTAAQRNSISSGEWLIDFEEPPMLLNTVSYDIINQKQVRTFSPSWHATSPSSSSFSKSCSLH